jgi:hypothetical protein
MPRPGEPAQPGEPARPLDEPARPIVFGRRDRSTPQETLSKPY